MAKLTPVELRVLECLAAGLSGKQVARVLDRSPVTVADHKKSIFKKLQTRTSAGAVGAAYRNGHLPLKQHA